MSEFTDDMSILKKWIGRSHSSTQRIDSRPASLMNLLLDRDYQFNHGDQLPSLWHWLYFVEAGKQSDLGYDGHLKLGGFLPPVSLPRRMWASGEFHCSHPIEISDEVTQHSTIKDIQIKKGRSGKLCFVTVEHHYRVDQIECLNELHHIVYRDRTNQLANSASDLDKLPNDLDWQIEIKPDPVMLFRYSALTFNGHRIHYDRDFCTHSEGYPGLIFHGPITATLLIDKVKQQYPEIGIKRYSFRALKPIFDLDTVTWQAKSQIQKSIYGR